MPRIRTGYSFRAAAGSIGEVLERLKEVGMTSAPITDTASTFGWVRWAARAAKEGLKPVFGVELAVSPSIHAKKPSIDGWTFLAKEDVANVNRLVGLATEQFRYQPLLTYEQAASAEGVFKIAGKRCLLDRVDADDPDLFFPLAPSTAVGHWRRAMGMGLRPVAVSDNRYPKEGDGGFYEVLCGRGASTQTYPQHILNRSEWLLSIEHLTDDPDLIAVAEANAAMILEGCNAKLKKATLVKPDRPASLRAMCEEGAQELGVDLTDPDYSERLDRELTLILEKDFEDYFYIVADICTWARKRMIVGPARGSSCGSLVCYLLKITTVDPLQFGLIFERFIDINRDDLPDIDIDFSDQHRGMVFEYVNRKYGHDHVARLGTVALFRPRSALQEVGTALKLPRWKCDAVAESLINRSSGDSRALATLEDTLRTMPAGKKLLEDHPEAIITARFEGHPRHHSQHAAGIVISSEPIESVVAVDRRTGATMCDKMDAETFNLLKIDALGLTQLSIFEDALELAGLPLDALEKLPLDDPKALSIFNEKRLAGIFQFNGQALRSITNQFEIEKFDDIVNITALARPGPLASGGAEEWVQRRNGKSSDRTHPVLQPFLEDTNGIVIYQEQVMEIGRQVGDLSWSDVTALRKAMSKSLGTEFFDKYGDPWKKGAISKGIPPELANKVWDDLCAYGSWSFNKSHSVAYGLLSYWCAWLKAHHLFEFAAASLTHEKKTDNQVTLLRELAAEGVPFLPFSEEFSREKWTVGLVDGERHLIAPLSNVKGIGPKSVSTIIGARERGEKLPSGIKKKLDSPKFEIESLWPIRDAFDRIMPDPAERNIFTKPTRVVDLEIRSDDYDVLLFVTPKVINPRDENEAVKIASRGYEIKDGPTASLNMHLTDDTDTIFGKIGRWAYEKLGRPIVDRGRPGKSLYAIKGKMKGGTGSFRMVMVNQVRYIGDIDDEERAELATGEGS